MNFTAAGGKSVMLASLPGLAWLDSQRGSTATKTARLLDTLARRLEAVGHAGAAALLSGALGRDEIGEGKRSRGSQRRGTGEEVRGCSVACV